MEHLAVFFTDLRLKKCQHTGAWGVFVNTKEHRLYTEERNKYGVNGGVTVFRFERGDYSLMWCLTASAP